MHGQFCSTHWSKLTFAFDLDVQQDDENFRTFAWKTRVPSSMRGLEVWHISFVDFTTCHRKRSCYIQLSSVGRGLNLIESVERWDLNVLYHHVLRFLATSSVQSLGKSFAHHALSHEPCSQRWRYLQNEARWRKLEHCPMAQCLAGIRNVLSSLVRWRSQESQLQCSSPDWKVRIISIIPNPQID